MQTLISHSDEVDEVDAIEEVLESCRRELGGLEPKGGLLFSSAEYDHAVLLEHIHRAWPGLPLVGGSSDGELSSTRGFCDDSVLLTLFAGDDVCATVGLGRDLSRDIEHAVDTATASLRAALGGRAPNLCLTTFAPSTNSSAVVRALNRRLPAGCVVAGGLTGDHREFKRTREFFGTEVLGDSLPVLFLAGDFHASCGVGSGWFPIGTDRTVTRSEGHIVYEIDGEPALSTYHEHYGVVAHSSLGEYPLALMDDGGSWSLRAILDLTLENGALAFAGEVPTGSRVRITEVLPEGILSGSAQSMEAALQSFGGDPELALVFSCAARKWVLGTQAEREIGELRACARRHGHADLGIAGLYCFGEISPPAAGAQSCFHNETCVTVLLGK